MALPKNIKAILFDCDNTLVMSEERAFEGCASLINDICEKKKVPLKEKFTGPSLLKEFVGQNFRGMVTTLQGTYNFDWDDNEGKELEGYVKEEMYRVIKKLRDGIRECEGVKDQLDALKALNDPETNKRTAELEATGINEELEAERKANEEQTKKHEETVAAWKKAAKEENDKGNLAPLAPAAPSWTVIKKEKFDELQKELDAFKSGVAQSELLYELRKKENWKLEAIHRFNTEVAAYEEQERKKQAKIDAKKAAEAEGKTWEMPEEDKIPVEYREKDFVRPTKLTASTPLLLIVVSSSAKARVEVSIEEGKLLDFFGTRIFSAATSLPEPTSKPNPAVYKFAMEQWGVRPEECIAVEDSVSGATAGRSAKIPTIGYVWPYTEETPDKSEEMAVKLKDLAEYETKAKTECNTIMRHWREFPELLKELDDAAEKPKASI